MKAIKVSASLDYNLTITFADGKEGVFECSDFLQHGIFRRLLEDRKLFLNPKIINNGRAIARDEQLDIDVESCYNDVLSGKTIL